MSKDSQKKQLKNLARISGLGAQLAATIFIGAFIGNYLDTNFPISEKKIYTLALTLFSLALGLYATIKRLNRK